MSKKSKFVISGIAVCIIGLVVYGLIPKCEICDKRSTGVSEHFDYMICVDCYNSVMDENESTSYSFNNSSFRNKYGTATTKCAHSGCSNYIAASGDTNCCVTHSNLCTDCNCYIDEDAAWCVSCLQNATN